MDQDLYDIDPEYRKKYDTDMQKRAEAQEARRAEIQKTKANLRADVLSMSDEDFGSKYGRDRTAKEVATRNAYDAAGYKEAEADYKKEQAKKPVQGRLDIDDAERKNREANAKKSIQDLRDLREGKITNDELKERVRARGGAGGGIPLDKMDKMKKMNYKAGGKVTASSRADGCAIRGKTKGRMV
jgi:hypothetical protein